MLITEDRTIKGWQNKMNKKTRTYLRVCIRCEKLYNADSQKSKICEMCKKKRGENE